MATESKRFKYEPIPGVVELSREEIAQTWMKRLPANMESFYASLPSKGEDERKRWGVKFQEALKNAESRIEKLENELKETPKVVQ